MSIAIFKYANLYLNYINILYVNTMRNEYNVLKIGVRVLQFSPPKKNFVLEIRWIFITVH